MELKDGYKRTDFGIIPSDWEVTDMETVCKLINGRGFKPFEWKKEGLPIIRIQNLNGSDVFNYYNGRYDKKIEVDTDQLLFAWSGSRGTSFGPHIWKGGKGLLNYHTWKINVYENKIHKDYFLHTLKVLTKQIEDSAHGASALVHVQKWEIEKVKFFLPKSKPEQTAIATTLSDTDALIASLEKLIAKKQNIKKGVIQKLLEPKEGWEAKRLGECLIRNPDYGINAAAVPYNESLPKYLRITDISEDGKYLKKDKVSVANINSSMYYLEEGDMVFARTGASVGKAYLYKPDDGKLVFAGFLIRLKFNTRILIPEYFYFYTQTRAYWNWIRANSMRTGQPGINGKEYQELEVPLPKTIEEQISIVQTISSLDNEISVLETKMEKQKKLKQGMMRVLLAGKIRLI